jgi:hypothetical protein
VTIPGDAGSALRAAEAQARELLRQRRVGDALAIYDRLQAVAPDDPQLAVAHGLALLQAEDSSAALRHFERMVRRFPTLELAWQGLGKALCDLQRPAEAIEVFSRAATLAREPALALYHRGLARLLAGDFAQGWADFERRLDAPGLGHRTFAQPRWDGSPLAGRRLLVICEQGYGDVFQFARFLPLLRALDGAVTFECPADIAPLLAPLAGGLEIIPLAGREPPPVAFDCYAALLSLPHLLGVGVESFAASVPYLHAPAPPSRPTDGALRIGVAWAGRSTHPQDHQRSFDPELLAPLARIPRVLLYSMQKDPGSRPPLPGLTPFLRAPPRPLDNFFETAALIVALDLVICVDTAVAHLAGALGRPVWVALGYANDWRWMLKRTDSPWYPSMRLYRQPRPGAWSETVAAMRDDLAAMLATGDRPGSRG